MTDIFNETLDELRQEKTFRIFKKFGLLFSATLLLFLVLGGIYIGIKTLQNNKVIASAHQYYELYSALEAHNDAKAGAILADNTTNAKNNYSALTMIEQVRQQIGNHDIEAARFTLNTIAANKDFSPILRDYALLKRISIDMSSNQREILEALSAEIQGLLKKRTLLSYTALELLAYTYLKLEMPGKAKEIFQDLIDDPKTPQDIAERSKMAIIL